MIIKNLYTKATEIQSKKGSISGPWTQVDPEAHIGKEKILQQHMRILLASSGRKHRQAEEAGFFAPKSGNVSGPKGQCFHPEHCRFRQSYPHPSDHGAFSQAWGKIEFYHRLHGFSRSI